MKKILIILILFLSLPYYVSADTIHGGIAEKVNKNLSRIIDKRTGEGIGGAKITLPKQHYKTTTDKEGYFELNTVVNDNSIMLIRKDKYKPFSMTINDKTFREPLVVGIEKSAGKEISIDSNLHHLGDNSFSKLSANASEFHSQASGPFYTKKFNLKNVNLSEPVYLVIGSIIGIDTLVARTMGQNHTPNAYASPPEVYFNGNKISEIQINGDGQRIKIPPSLIKKHHPNEVTIKTGRNIMQTAYIDYDDIEFMNLSIEN